MPLRFLNPQRKRLRIQPVSLESQLALVGTLCHPQRKRMAGDSGCGAKALRGSLPRGSKLQMPVFQKTFQAALTEHAPWRGGPGVRKLRDSAGPMWGLQPPDGGDGFHGRPGTSHVGAGWGRPGRSPGSGRRSPCLPTRLPGTGPRVAVQNRPRRTPTKRTGKGGGLLSL